MTGTEFIIEEGGTVHSAHYFVSGKKCIVVSNCGQGSAPLDEEAPLRVAQRVLGQLVHRREEQQEAMRHSDTMAASAAH
jgi:hypothetical protein